MPVPRVSASALLILLEAIASPAAGEQEPPIGDGRTALPGVVRVPMSQHSTARLSAAVDAGYGLTESQKQEGAHQRIQGSLALGLVAARWLELGMLGSVRYDQHPRDGVGSDSGTIGQFSLVSRVSTDVAKSLRLGVDFGAAFPGSEQLSDTLISPALDLRGLLAWVPRTGIRVAGYAGYRYDRTSGVGNNAPRYRSGDRLALGLSDFNAMLVGAGVVVPFGRTEILGETTVDWLVGSGAPQFRQSPIRFDLGIRYALSGRLWTELLTELSPSARPDLSPDAALVPLEPRWGISLGLRYRIWGGDAKGPAPTAPHAVIEPLATTAATTDPVPANPPETKVATPATSRVMVAVFDSAGHPLSDAVVALHTDTAEIPLEFQTGSTFVAEAVPVGRARIKVHAELMRDWEREVEIEKANAFELRVEMTAAETSAQIRGLVRAFNGKTLAANVHIEPGNREERAGADGAFNIDVPAGKYRVRVYLDGYQPQERSVEVGKNGVMVLNVDLQKDR